MISHHSPGLLHEQAEQSAMLECSKLFAFQAPESSSLCAVAAEITLEKLPGLLVSSHSLALISLLCSPGPVQMCGGVGVGGCLHWCAEVRGYVRFEKPFAGRGRSKSNDAPFFATWTSGRRTGWGSPAQL